MVFGCLTDIRAYNNADPEPATRKRLPTDHLAGATVRAGSAPTEEAALNHSDGCRPPRSWALEGKILCAPFPFIVTSWAHRVHGLRMNFGVRGRFFPGSRSWMQSWFKSLLYGRPRKAGRFRTELDARYWLLPLIRSVATGVKYPNSPPLP